MLSTILLFSLVMTVSTLLSSLVVRLGSTPLSGRCLGSLTMMKDVVSTTTSAVATTVTTSLDLGFLLGLVIRLLLIDLLGSSLLLTHIKYKRYK